MKWKRYLLIGLMLLIAGSGLSACSRGQSLSADWRTASREPTGIAPNPLETPEAVVQVYSARAFNWRGLLGVHTWIASKRSNVDSFLVYEVIGWRLYRNMPVVAISQREPDQRWFGSEPEILFDVRGDQVDAMIDDIEAAVVRYPYNEQYKVWPGPNSNTFTAFVAREVPGLRLDLPPTAIGKDFLGDEFFARTPSGSGVQFSLFGVFGVMAALEEGVEVNLLGLTFGLDPMDLAIKLPGVGRLSLLSD